MKSQFCSATVSSVSVRSPRSRISHRPERLEFVEALAAQLAFELKQPGVRQDVLPQVLLQRVHLLT